LEALICCNVRLWQSIFDAQRALGVAHLTTEGRLLLEKKNFGGMVGTQTDIEVSSRGNVRAGEVRLIGQEKRQETVS